jgi:two-component system, LuxR family, sensor histidine kinase DctS
MMTQTESTPKKTLRKSSIERFLRSFPFLVTVATFLTIAVFTTFAVLVWRYEFSESQIKLDKQLQRLVTNMRTTLLSDVRSLQVSGAPDELPTVLTPLAKRLGSERKSLVLVELHRPGYPPLALYQRADLQGAELLNRAPTSESLAANEAAIRRGEVVFAPSYFLPVSGFERTGQEFSEGWLPLQIAGSNAQATARVRLIFNLRELMADLIPVEFSTSHELSLREADGTVLAWGQGLGRGAGVFKSTAIFDLPASPMVLHANSEDDGPRLIPNLLYALLVLLGISLLASIFQLLRDMRRRVGTEAQLRESIKFRQAMENSLITGLRARDLNGRVTYVNPAFCEMVGFSADQIIGRDPPMPYWAPEARDEYERRYAQVLAGTITAEGFETIFMRPDGSRFPALVYEAPLINDSGKQTGWMGSIVDLTERREIEAINRQQQEKLERASRLSTMGELASVLSHELNQPLSAIASYATGAGNLVSQVPATSVPEGLGEVLTTIQIQAKRAGDIVHRMHDFVRQREPRREPLELVELITTLQALINLQARGKNIRLNFNLLASLAWVDADRVLLEQVLLNLTRNAVEAVSEQARGEPQIDIELRELEEHFEVRVIDNGPGVPVELVERLFSMYVSTKAQGMGIGLNICRNVLERFGGKMWYEPAVSGGACFAFSLPRSSLLAMATAVH